MSIKKYINGSWTPASRKYGTETDTITTLPATIIGDGTPISSYTTKGNMEQNGTPTPSSPIYPSECGEKTENLIYSLENGTKTGIGITATIKQNSSEFVLSSVTSSSDRSLSIETDVTIPAGTYTIAVDGLIYYPGEGTDRLYLRKNDTSVIINSVYTGFPRTFTISETTNIDRFVIVCGDKSEYNNQTVRVWLLRGSYTAQNLPEYIPYGYKLPLTLGSTTTDIYLGEVQSTRRIKKLVLTGTETWNILNTGGIWQFYTDSIISGLAGSSIMSNIAKYGVTSDTRADYDYGAYLVSSGRSIAFQMRGSRGTFVDVASWTAFLAEQYANGTPVTVWYVLAEPKTAVVNEPIRKIGDYVDSVSGTGLVTSGAGQAFDINTTLKPSEVDMSYHGWHEHDDTKYSA